MRMSRVPIWRPEGVTTHLANLPIGLSSDKIPRLLRFCRRQSVGLNPIFCGDVLSAVASGGCNDRPHQSWVIVDRTECSESGRSIWEGRRLLPDPGSLPEVIAIRPVVRFHRRNGVLPGLLGNRHGQNTNRGVSRIGNIDVPGCIEGDPVGNAQPRTRRRAAVT